jgi:hypothetical protein
MSKAIRKLRGQISLRADGDSNKDSVAKGSNPLTTDEIINMTLRVGESTIDFPEYLGDSVEAWVFLNSAYSAVDCYYILIDQWSLPFLIDEIDTSLVCVDRDNDIYGEHKQAKILISNKLMPHTAVAITDPEGPNFVTKAVRTKEICAVPF